MTGSIKDRVAIVGMGCTKFGERWDADVQTLLVEACTEALADSGLTAGDVQAGWLGSMSSLSSGQPLARALKLDYIPISRVENYCATGTDAFRNACFAVAAGIYDVVLVAGVEKLKDSGFSGLVVDGPVGSEIDAPVPPPSQFALLATSYFGRYGIPLGRGREALSQIAVKNHFNGRRNARAHFQREITLKEAMEAPMVAWPLALYDCCAVSDGAAAAVITRPEIARTIRDDFVMVKGLGLAVSGGYGLLRDDYAFTSLPETERAAREAYAQAGIGDPRNEIDLAVVHDCFTITELVTYEDLGLSERGHAIHDVFGGAFTLEGPIPVNTDGGLKCFGHPIGASGIRMLYEVYKQIQGLAGTRQMKRQPRLGLTHNLGGLAGSFTGAVTILGNPS